MPKWTAAGLPMHLGGQMVTMLVATHMSAVFHETLPCWICPRGDLKVLLRVAATATRPPTNPTLVWRHRSTRPTACPGCPSYKPPQRPLPVKPGISGKYSHLNPSTESRKTARLYAAKYPQPCRKRRRTLSSFSAKSSKDKGFSNVTRCPIAHTFARMQPGGQQTNAQVPGFSPRRHSCLPDD
ncbi:uncharacterized protein M421DRAFT_356658 [Didymella exigua CBS 183.55]|uniref:Secreted protein n=1 Tax=Didymella exigua CBS 183.55 TaxID=1150837 RepID=A0A6A5RU73_9PLEO|nr:uncharacterized protein M421DRAFT_356658 [Didymella exigua CBS 183.55]KAF1930704.1 hypothetical protein M421DRAFT_356658 [Didymella exigua CBS 183.55]